MRCHEQQHGRERQETDRQHRKLGRADRHGGIAALPQGERPREAGREPLRPAGLAQAQALAQRQRQAQRGDEEGQRGAAQQRAQDEPVRGGPQRQPHRHGRQHRPTCRQPGAGLAQEMGAGQGRQRPEGAELAEGEVDPPDQAVEQAVAQGQEGVDRGRCGGVQELLRQIGQGPEPRRHRRQAAQHEGLEEEEGRGRQLALARAAEAPECRLPVRSPGSIRQVSVWARPRAT